MSIVRDFIAQLMPDELARLPEGVRPGRFADAQDIADFALLIKMHDLDGQHPEPDPELQARITSFFSSAAERVTQVSPVVEREQEGGAG